MADFGSHFQAWAENAQADLRRLGPEDAERFFDIIHKQAELMLDAATSPRPGSGSGADVSCTLYVQYGKINIMLHVTDD